MAKNMSENIVYETEIHFIEYHEGASASSNRYFAYRKYTIFPEANTHKLFAIIPVRQELGISFIGTTCHTENEAKELIKDDLRLLEEYENDCIKELCRIVRNESIYESPGTTGKPKLKAAKEWLEKLRQRDRVGLMNHAAKFEWNIYWGGKQVALVQPWSVEGEN